MMNMMRERSPAPPMNGMLVLHKNNATTTGITEKGKHKAHCEEA